MTLKGHLAQLSCNEQEHPELNQGARSPSTLSLDVSRDRAIHCLSGHPVPVPHTLMVKNFFLISNLNLPSCSLKPFLLVLSQQTLLKSLSPSFLQLPLQILSQATLRSPWIFFFSRMNSPSSQPVLIGKVFHPLDRFCVLSNASFSSTTYKTFKSVKIEAIHGDRFMAIPQVLAHGQFCCTYGARLGCVCLCRSCGCSRVPAADPSWHGLGRVSCCGCHSPSSKSPEPSKMTVFSGCIASARF